MATHIRDYQISIEEQEKLFKELDKKLINVATIANDKLPAVTFGLVQQPTTIADRKLRVIGTYHFHPFYSSRPWLLKTRSIEDPLLDNNSAYKMNYKKFVTKPSHMNGNLRNDRLCNFGMSDIAPTITITVDVIIKEVERLVTTFEPYIYCLQVDFDINNLVLFNKYLRSLSRSYNKQIRYNLESTEYPATVSTGFKTIFINKNPLSKNLVHLDEWNSFDINKIIEPEIRKLLIVERASDDQGKEDYRRLK